MRLTRRDLLRASAALAASSAFPARSCWPAQPSVERPLSIERPLPWGGINLASAEFGTVPGRDAIDYVYPGAGDVAYFSALGFNCFRIPFRWERLQPALASDLDAAELRHLTFLVGEVTRRGHTAILDPHNFARRRIIADNWAHEHLIGSAAVPVHAFEDFWRRLAAAFKNDEHIVFALMNEPYGISAAAWLKTVNRVIAAIRGTGATNLLTVPGTNYTGAHSWLSSGNAIFAETKDPHNRFAIEVHQYFDGNSSGTTPRATSGCCGSDRLRSFQEWARANKLKAFLGEFGGAANPASLNALSDICQEMSANPDVWLGWTAWSAGPFWPSDYMFNLGAAPDGGLREQTRILSRYACPSSDSFWVWPGASVDCDLSRERVFGCGALTASLAFDGQRRAHSSQGGAMRVQGPLLDVLQAPDFTLLIETENFANTSLSGNIVTVGGKPLLARTAFGALRSTKESGVRTYPELFANWRLRRKSAVSIRRSTMSIAIGGTGCGSALGAASIPKLEEVVIGSGYGEGRIVRITGFADYLEGSALERLVA